MNHCAAISYGTAAACCMLVRVLVCGDGENATKVCQKVCHTGDLAHLVDLKYAPLTCVTRNHRLFVIINTTFEIGFGELNYVVCNTYV